VAEIMANDEYEFSYCQLRHKVRRLLQRWHSHVLSVPKLCRLGYGGFVKRKSSILDDNASMSSWGIAEDEYKERQEMETDDDDIEGYATAPDEKADDETADEADVNTAFAFSTQPPFPEADTESPEKKKDAESVDDGDKKPRAKRKKAQQEESDAETEPRTFPRRSSRLADTGAAASSPLRKTTDENEPKKKAAVKRSPRLASVVYGEEEATPRKENSDESISEPESSLPRKPAPAVARRPPPADDDSDSEPGPPRKPAPAVARRPPRAARLSKGKATVIEWSSESEGDVAPPAKRARSSSAGRRSLSDMPRGVKKPKKRRPFTDEEKEAIRAGVQRFGEGRWALIRLNSDGILLSRTNVNIKDCYRNMLKRNEGA
jgi:hypothetical protein